MNIAGREEHLYFVGFTLSMLGSHGTDHLTGNIKLMAILSQQLIILNNTYVVGSKNNLVPKKNHRKMLIKEM